MTVEEFAGEFFQDVLAEADAEGQFVEDVFFHKFCEHLMEAGELDSADPVAYQGQPGRGIRVDGYGGDPAEDDSDTFSLLISDFHPSADVGRLIGSEMNAIFRRLSNFLRHALDRKWRDALEETSPAFGLADLLSKRWSGIGRVRLFLITNRELSERVDGREADELDGRTITYSVWDIGRLYRQATVGHGREDIDVDLAGDFDGPLAVLPAQQPEADHESYLAIMPGKVLAAIYDRWGTRLLEQNVRVFLQHRGKVNKGIRATIENEPNMFFAYNNGITATAEEVEIDEDGGRLLLRRLKNFQIVNGGQTTASIHSAQRGKVEVSQTFVQMKLSVVESGTGEQTGAQDIRVRQQPEPGQRGRLLRQSSIPRSYGGFLPAHPRAVTGRHVSDSPSGSTSEPEASTRTLAEVSRRPSARSSIWRTRAGSSSRRRTWRSSSTSGRNAPTR